MSLRSMTIIQQQKIQFLNDLLKLSFIIIELILIKLLIEFT